MMQQKKPKDYVISTGLQYTVKEFVNLTAKQLDMKIIWKGKNLKEKAFFKNKEIISIDKKYFRPTEVGSLKGDSKLARKELGWKPIYNIKSLINEMIDDEYRNL